MSGQTAAATDAAHHHDDDWNGLLASLDSAMAAAAAGGNPALFTTDADGAGGGALWAAFIGGLPEEARPMHGCRTCRHFVRRFGGLARINPDGSLDSAVWRPSAHAPLYAESIAAVTRLVRRASVTGVFLTRQAVLGTPRTGGWTHLAVPVPNVPAVRHRSNTASDEAAMAAKRQDFETVGRALAAFSAASLQQAKRVLEADALSRAERYVAPLQWLIDAQADRHATPGRRGDNLLWRRIATAPPGFCHPKSSVLAPLLDGIEAGLPFEALADRWGKMLDPLRYQRAQAAPDRGNIEQAEKIVARMGLAPSLARRHARLDEVLAAAGPAAVWTPPPGGPAHPSVPPGPGVFGHLWAKERDAGFPGGTPAVDLPTRPMTWEKFRRDVLPSARALDVLVGPGAGPYLGLTTAEDPEAPPILKWDRPEHRNPFAWYVYSGGSHPQVWNLLGGWTPVAAVVPMPPAWGPAPLMRHSYEGVVFLLQGARDAGTNNSALFAEFMVQELFPVRATIEAYSKSRPLAGSAEAGAAGWNFRKGATTPGEFPTLRVRDPDGHRALFRIDRWD